MIAVFSGTSDGQSIVHKLLERGLKVCCFNATKYGGSLYSAREGLVIYDHMMTYDELKEKLAYHKIKIIVDATHPYAEVISQNLITISQKDSYVYYRYERKAASFNDTAYESYEALIDALELTEGNILLTIGSNNLERFTTSRLKDRLYCRVLPTLSVIEKCHSLGIKTSRIIGVQGPFSQKMNEVSIKDYAIKHLVTKESGLAGGFSEKVMASKTMNITCHVLERPMIFYPNRYDDSEKLVKALELVTT